MIIGNHLICANIGDSRAVLCKKGKAINLSWDHKPQRPDEVKRIQKNKGNIQFGRVGGNLAITRAFGDFEFKIIEELKQRNNLIVSEPEIRCHLIDPNEDEFIVMASDGLFDKFKSQEACDVIRKYIQKSNFLQDDMDVIS